ncbi:MAG: retropepsin-like domain-containing protein [Treponema sp.]|jgi:clan AA aspartic protease|nr:retropepsin-like domain-containing protein [Treponema sp.]
MGQVITEITLINAADAENVYRGFISAEEVRKAVVEAVVDTGATYLAITEELYAKLGLREAEIKNVHLANGSVMRCVITSGVILQCQKRETVLPAVVVPGATKVLLGALPLEAMDFMVHPLKQKLVGVHGDEELLMIL